MLGVWDNDCVFCVALTFTILLSLLLALAFLVDALRLWHLEEVVVCVVCEVGECLEEGLLFGVFGDLADVLVAHERFLHACEVSTLPALARLCFVFAVGHVECVTAGTLAEATVH